MLAARENCAALSSEQCRGMQVVLATGEGGLVCLDVTDNKLTEKAHVKLNGEVSCIDITPLDDAERSQIAAVGTWDMQACSLSGSAALRPEGPVASSLACLQSTGQAIAPHSCTVSTCEGHKLQKAVRHTCSSQL